MKPFRQFSAVLVANFALLVVAGVAQGQSLGDAARKLRQNKPAETSPKVITNDDLREAPLAPALPEAKSDSADAKNPADDKDKDKNAEAEKAKKTDPEADQAKLDKEWSKKIDDQKQKIADMAHELDLMQRENKLRAASYYADAGTRLRNQQSYAEEDRKYQKDIADKQKELDDAKANLADLQEEARKAGASAKSRE